MKFMPLNRRFTIPLAGLLLLALFLSGAASIEAKEIELSPHESDEIEFTGEVDSIVVNEWRIDGVLVIVSDQTEVEGEIQVGDMVEIHATPDDQGVLHAREIELSLDDDMDLDDDDDDNDDLDDDDDDDLGDDDDDGDHHDDDDDGNQDDDDGDDHDDDDGDDHDDDDGDDHDDDDGDDHDDDDGDHHNDEDGHDDDD